MTEIMFTGRNSCKGIHINNLQVRTVRDMHLVINMSVDLTKGSFGHFSSFYVITILKTSKISIFCIYLHENQIASNM